MPEDYAGRSWFSYRYAFPGFVFIIFVVLMNLDAFRFLVSARFLNLDAAAFTAVLTFLSGPAVGFIVAQVYYLLVRLGIRRLFFRKSRELIESAKIVSKGSLTLMREGSFMADFDYWAFAKIEKPLLTYLTRRWDLFQVLSSTALSIVIGMIVGYVLKISGLTKSIVYTIALLLWRLFL